MARALARRCCLTRLLCPSSHCDTYGDYAASSFHRPSQSSQLLPRRFCIADADGDGNLTYEEFMAFIRNAEIQHNTANMLPKIKDIPVEEAVLMIKEKILSQLASGKAATNLRRAFQAVDLDGSGTIEMDELSEVLRVKSSLDFEDGLMKRCASLPQPTTFLALRRYAAVACRWMLTSC